RAEILPLTAALRPESARRAARTAELLREASLILDEKVALVFGHSTSWSRSELRAQSGLILGSGLRRSAARVLGERLGDRLSSRLIDAAVRAIRDDSTEPREFQWPGGLIVRVTAGRVEMTR
ncbi:MAG: hypothetical protein JNK58_05400, partial [Phycisphaerae bacterium]|nr:hypothetical protein [Phycisphaerae bacterium]